MEYQVVGSHDELAQVGSRLKLALEGFVNKGAIENVVIIEQYLTKRAAFSISTKRSEEGCWCSGIAALLAAKGG